MGSHRPTERIDGYRPVATMTKKRRNKPPNARGHVKFVRCALSSKAIPKDKAVKRYVVRNIVDAASLRDIMEGCAIDGYALPKLYHKMYFSISAAIHSHYVRVRSREGRRSRAPPKRFAPKRDDDKKKDAPGGAK